MKKITQKCVSIMLSVIMLCTMVPFSGVSFESFAADDIDVQIQLAADELVTPEEIQNPGEDMANPGEIGEYDEIPAFYSPTEPDPNETLFAELMERIQEYELTDGLPENWQEELNSLFAQAKENNVSEYVLQALDAIIADEDELQQFADPDGDDIPLEAIPDYAEAVTASWFRKLADTVSAVKDVIVDVVTTVVTIVTPVLKEIKTWILTSNDVWVGSLKYNLNNDARTATVSSVKSNIAGITIPESIEVEVYNDGTTQTYTVTSIADYAFTGINSLHVLNVPRTITSLKSGTFKASGLRYITFEGNGLTTVGNGAFACCGALKSVYLGSNVTHIGLNAFNGCTQLRYSIYLSADTMRNKPSNVTYDQLADGVQEELKTPFTLPNGIGAIEEYTFYNCENLGSITIPSTVTEIQAFAFAQSGIETFTSGSGLKTIKLDAFSSCKKLTTVSLSAVTTIGIDAFKDDIKLSSLTLGNSLQSIGLGAFCNCEKLTAVTIPTTVTSIGSNAFSMSGLAAINIPSSASLGQAVFSECADLTTATFASGVTSIPSWTFAECSSLESVTVPGVTVIDNHAFYRCGNLGAVNLSNVEEIGEKAFAECVALNSVVFSGDVWILNDAFMNCTSLKQLLFGSADIEKRAFYRCTGLTNITASDTIEAGDHAFCGCSALKTVAAANGIAEIGNYAFAKCSALTSITSFSSDLTGIGTYAFGECTSLSSVVISSSVTSIGESAFYKCSALETVTLGGVTEIKAWTFGLCDRLSSINIPSSVKTIGISAFRHCAALEEIDLSGCSKLTLIDTGAFNGCESLVAVKYPTALKTIGNRAFYNCPKLEELTFPENAQIETIGAQAYTYCTALTRISIPDSVVNISNALTFHGCTDLEIVSIGNGIKKINPYMFCGCSSLETLTIGNSVQMIGAYSFYGCSSLTIVDLQNNTNVELQDYVFLNCPSLESITVSENNSRYATLDGILYNKDMTELILCPAGKTGDVVLPDGVTQIAPYAFYNAKIANITLKSSLKSIGTYAFFDCSGLRHIEMSAGHQNNIEFIEAFAFYACTRAEGNPIGRKIQKIGQYAFYKCYKMFERSTVDVRTAVGTIGPRTFMYCTGLTKVILRDGVTSVADNAFSNHASGLIIYGTNGSEAQSYANQHGIPFEVIENKDLSGNVLVYGHPGVGRILRAVPETDDTNVSYTCAWYRNGELCGSSETYTVAQQDLAQTLTARLTGIDGYVGSLDSEEIKISGSYEEPVLMIRPDSGVELRSTGLIDDIVGIDAGQAPVAGYFIGVRALQMPESYASVTSGSLQAERPKTGGIVRLIKENCIVAEYRVVIPGDVNMDGEVTSEDKAMILAYMDGEEDLTAVQKLATDVNAELTLVHVTYSGDYTGMQNVRVGNSVKLPTCKERGYHYTFFCDYDPFDGKEPLTKDIEVTVVREEDLVIVGAPSSLQAGSTAQLTARLAVSGKEVVDVLWETSNPYVADVSETGLITAIKFGKATISAQDTIGRRSSRTISVTDDAIRLYINPLCETEMKIGLFESYSSVKMNLDYTAYNCTDAVRYEWSSDNLNVQVENGVVTHTGSFCRTAQITLTAYDASDNVVAEDSIEIRVYKIEKIADFLHKWFFWLGF